MLRVSGGALWAASNSATEPHRVWRLPSRGRVDALRVETGGGRCSVRFHQGGRVWQGAFDQRTLAHGPLVASDAPAGTEVSTYGQISPQQERP